jgi:hypothetical protein
MGLFDSVMLRRGRERGFDSRQKTASGEMTAALVASA